ncbi:hypothetical protein BOTBODRAFT_32404 [Botryobasidium botryosum FD-172 SS1]|uniref:Uncharacterized protein n=1 Tax=Botryobasidium botryosum (strain FD-172 SS1) TaxID=930990 RepID=A0A067MST1_BOTB1|nr:hypothetical protein BOTBODRAFT_32404 [Botryobasidium botryosum FD-172 SS1]
MGAQSWSSGSSTFLSACCTCSSRKSDTRSRGTLDQNRCPRSTSYYTPCIGPSPASRALSSAYAHRPSH